MEQILEPRIIRGYTIISRGDKITEIGDNVFSVPSQSGNGNYVVMGSKEGWVCTCPDFKYRKLICKHIHAVRFWLTLKKRLLEESKHVTLPDCKWCSSNQVIRYGREARKQVYKCKTCNRKFVVDEGFKKMRYEPKIITLTLDLYFKGTSLRKISDHLKQFYDLNVHFSTLYRWIKKYVELMSKYVDSVVPQLSGHWNVDEMKVRCKGDWVWIWNIMDKETRFLLASTISKKRGIKDARRVFQQAKKRAKSKPLTVTTDGLQAYTKAFKKEFFTLRNPRTKHIRKPRFKDKANNNIVERLNGTVRERNKVLRGLKKQDTPITKGFQIYYNFIRPHQALKGKTPAEESGIELGKDKWKSLIQKAILTRNQT